MRWQEIALRLMLIVGMVVAIAYDVPAWITAPLGLVAIAVTAELAVRPYATSAIDRLLLGCGGVVTTLILVGLILNLTPWGLTRTTWTVSWAILSIAVLVWHWRLRIDIPRPLRVKSFSVWILSAGLIFVVAAVLAVAGVRQWSQRPVLAFALVSSSADTVVVEIDSTSITETYRIVATSRASGARQYSSTPFTVTSGGNGSRLLERVPVNISGVWRIGLESSDSSATVRLLIVDVR